MTLMLASVTDAQEALVALRFGADIIDLKDPSHGALGALPQPVVRDAVVAVGGRQPVSATVGDLAPVTAHVVQAVDRMGLTGVDYIKIGCLGDGDWRGCIRALRASAPDTRLIGVLFADQAPDWSLLREMAAAGFHGAMLDTADKRVGSLTHHQPLPVLRRFVGRAQNLGLMTGLAGSLKITDVAPLLALAPDYLGFRSALCAGRRRGGCISAAAFRAVRNGIPRHAARPSAATA